MKELLNEIKHELYLIIGDSYSKRVDTDEPFKLCIDEMASPRITENRLYFVEMMNQAARQLDMNLIFAPTGKITKEGEYDSGTIISELGYQTNLPLTLEKLLDIFSVVETFGHPDESGYPFGTMLLDEIVKIEYNVYYEDERISGWEHEFELDDLEEEEIVK